MSAGTGPLAVFVGPPGAGKSTVGRIVARRLGVGFADTDELIVARAGRSIPDIFAESGEAAFRRLERAVVADALAARSGVLALGGGAVLSAATRARLRRHPVVHLDVSSADGVRRTAGSGRPLLAGSGPGDAERVYAALLAARAPHYREVATVTVATGGRGPADVAAAVLRALRRHVTDAA